MPSTANTPLHHLVRAIADRVAGNRSARKGGDRPIPESEQTFLPSDLLSDAEIARLRREFDENLAELQRLAGLPQRRARDVRGAPASGSRRPSRP